MNNRKSYVYKITCKITGEFYFGSSFRAKRDSYWGGGKRIRERISQYGKENFVKEILGEFNNRTIAHQVENQYIEQFRHDDKCLNERIEYHFGTYGEESCTKISAAHRGKNSPMRGKHHTEEVKAKIGAAQHGKIVSDETRAKIGAAKRGKHRTDETREKMSAAKHGKHWRKNPITGKREWYD